MGELNDNRNNVKMGSHKTFGMKIQCGFVKKSWEKAIKERENKLELLLLLVDGGIRMRMSIRISVHIAPLGPLLLKSLMCIIQK